MAEHVATSQSYGAQACLPELACEVRLPSSGPSSHPWGHPGTASSVALGRTAAPPKPSLRENLADHLYQLISFFRTHLDHPQAPLEEGRCSVGGLCQVQLVRDTCVPPYSSAIAEVSFPIVSVQPPPIPRVLFEPHAVVQRHGVASRRIGVSSNLPSCSHPSVLQHKIRATTCTIPDGLPNRGVLTDQLSDGLRHFPFCLAYSLSFTSEHRSRPCGARNSIVPSSALEHDTTAVETTCPRRSSLRYRSLVQSPPGMRPAGRPSRGLSHQDAG